MKSNNPFSAHGINYLSPSSINTYISDPPMWILRYLFGIRTQGGAGAQRGIAQEFVLANKYTTGSFDFNLLDTKFLSLCAEANLELEDSKTVKEKKSLHDFGKIIDANFKYKNLEEYQEKVEVPIEDLPIPIIGYIDFRFKKKIVDLKTTTRMPSRPTEAQKRQMALYSMAYPNLSLDLFFATPKDFKKFPLEGLSFYKKQLKKAAFGIQKLLSISDDKHEIASLFYPNLDSWLWSGTREEAYKIWS
jgi:hypothetical protein